LIQKDKHDEGSGTHIEDESCLRIASEKGVPFEDTVVNFTSEGEKQSDIEVDPDKYQSIEKDQEELVNVDNMDSEDIPLG